MADRPHGKLSPEHIRIVPAAAEHRAAALPIVARLQEMGYNPDTTGDFDVVVEGDEAIGVLKVGLTARDGSQWLYWMAVAAEHEGRGAGSHILSHVIDRAQEDETTLLKLTVHEDNPGAIHLYRKHGFEFDPDDHERPNRKMIRRP